MADRKVIVIMGATGAQGGSLARAILDDADSSFSVRAVTRDASGDVARDLAEAGADVVEADLNKPETVAKAFDGAYGAFCVTFYWEHFSPEKEREHARTMADAAANAGIEHAIWSTLEDTRKWVPLDDDRMPTLQENYKVPHFDAKGESDRYFEQAGVPTTFMLPSFYWDNMIHFGMGPQRGEDGTLSIAFPMGDKRLAGIASEDIGKCAYGIFKSGKRQIDRRIGIAGDHLSGEEMAATLSDVLGEQVRYHDVPADVYRDFDFPGSEDIGNMFQFYRDFEDDCLKTRDVAKSRDLNPELKDFRTWLEANRERIPIE